MNSSEPYQSIGLMCSGPWHITPAPGVSGKRRREVVEGRQIRARALMRSDYDDRGVLTGVPVQTKTSGNGSPVRPSSEPRPTRRCTRPATARDDLYPGRCPQASAGSRSIGLGKPVPGRVAISGNPTPRGLSRRVLLLVDHAVHLGDRLYRELDPGETSQHLWSHLVSERVVR